MQATGSSSTTARLPDKRSITSTCTCWAGGRWRGRPAEDAGLAPAPPEEAHPAAIRDSLIRLTTMLQGVKATTMAESLKERLRGDLNAARRERDKLRTQLLTTTLSELKN